MCHAKSLRAVELPYVLGGMGGPAATWASGLRVTNSFVDVVGPDLQQRSVEKTIRLMCSRRVPENRS